MGRPNRPVVQGSRLFHREREREREEKRRRREALRQERAANRRRMWLTSGEALRMGCRWACSEDKMVSTFMLSWDWFKF